MLNLVVPNVSVCGGGIPHNYFWLSKARIQRQLAVRVVVKTPTMTPAKSPKRKKNT